ncbi:MAG TPA: ABC transporter permease [Rubricoccaceae bacterium]|nr:ABC transporter permease [Rubricoccaceae bacterium]
MLKSHLRIAWRNLAKYPVYTLLTVGGLALGIAAAFVLGLYVRQELTYEAHFEDADRIYRVATDFFEMGGFAKSQWQLADVLPQAVPAVERVTRVNGSAQATLVRVGDRLYEEPGVLSVDSAFFGVFSYRFLAGRRETAMHAPDEAVLSEALARKYFGTEDPLGRVLLVGKERTPYRVTGVVATPPSRSHLAADLWLPLVPEEPIPGWTNVTNYNYVRLRPGATRADLERGLEGVLRTQVYPASGFDGSFEAWSATPQAVRLWAQPLTAIHLHSDYNFETAPGGDPTLVYVLALIGLFVLFIAGVNYVNLSTARASGRAKEVGVKKTMGASRRALVQQFLTEAVVLSVAAMALAAALAEAMLAAFTSTTGAVLVDSLFADARYVLALFGFSVLAGLVAGLYPALYLSGLRPASVIKGVWTVKGNRRLRGGLVVVQFAVAVALATGALVVREQLAFMRETDKGFDAEGVVVVENADVLGERAEAFRQAVEAIPQVERTAFARRIPTGSGVWMYTYRTPRMAESVTLQTFPVDADLLPTLGMRLVAGRNFSGDLASDSSAVILNEAAVRALGLPGDPLGQEVNEGQRVIGVVADFHFQSLREAVEPVVLTYDAAGTQLAVRLAAAGAAAFPEALRVLWQRFGAEEPVRYAFLDDNFARFAEHERMLGRAVTFFTLLALLIAALGLFGLAAFTVQRRTKEIGIRKALGAGVADVVALLASEFGRLVLVGCVAAAPLAYVAMSRWLEGFAYRVDLGALPFLMAGAGALALALLTVSYHALRAATADPVQALRYE